MSKISEKNKKEKTTKKWRTLILVIIIIAVIVSVFIWVNETREENEDSGELSGLVATERIVIEEVNLKADTANCQIYVRNIGKTIVSLDHVFISLSNGTGPMHPYSKTYSPPTLTTSPNSVIQGELIIINISLDFTPGSNEAYTVKVFTDRGVVDTYQIMT